MVYKKYVRVNGKLHGPYYYESYREGSRVKKRYLGTRHPNEQEKPKKAVVPQKSLKFLKVFGILILLIVLVSFLRPTGNVALQINEESFYELNDDLVGSLSVLIDEGETVQKDVGLVLELIKDDAVVAENRLSLEEYINGQVDFVELSEVVESCEGVVSESVEEVCQDVVIDETVVENCVEEEVCTFSTQACEVQEVCVEEGNETVCEMQEVCGGEEQRCEMQTICTNETIVETELICENQTVQTSEQSCTNQTIIDYYYDSSGAYSRNIDDLMSYTFAGEGEYVLSFSIPSMNLIEERTLTVESGEDGSEQQSQDDSEDAEVFGAHEFTTQSNGVNCDYNLSSCKTSGWVAGSVYCLNQSLVTSGSASCLNITADFVTIDCQGYNITGDKSYPSAGIRVGQFGLENIDDTIIKNCKIYDVYYGVIVDRSGNATIRDNILMNVSNGVYLISSTGDNYVENNTITLADYNGILISGNRNLVNNNRITNTSSNGISFVTGPLSSFNNVTNNVLENASSYGISLSQTTFGALILNNSVNNSKEYGIRISFGGSNSSVINNTITNNKMGLYMSPANYTIVSGNIIENNLWNGIWVGSNSFGNVFSDTRSCFNNQSAGDYYDVRDFVTSSYDSMTCDTSSGTTANCQFACRAPATTEFPIGFGSTNFSAVADLGNVTNLTLANQFGRIQFPVNYGVNSTDENYDFHIEIGEGFVSVNITALHNSFNSTADITISNLSSCPQSIYYTEGFYTSRQDIIGNGSICDSSTNPNCTQVVCSGNNLTFTTGHFSGFATQQANIPPNVTEVFVNATTSANLTDDGLFCWVNATDADGDNLSYSGEWYRNGIPFVGQYWNVVDTSGFAANGVATDSQDNVIITGRASNDYYTVKYNSLGSQVWTNDAGVSGTDTPYGVATDSLDNVIVTGGNGANDYYTVKYNSSGSQLWNVTDVVGQVALDVAIDGQNEVVVTGSDASSDWYTVKYDSSGNHLWNVSDSFGFGAADGIATDSLDNVIITGRNSSSDWYTVKYNSSGSQLWNVTDVVGQIADGVATDSQDNVIVTGRASSDFYTVKYDSSGNQLWNVSDSFGFGAESIGVDSQDNIVITGKNSSGDGWYTVKYDSSGNQLWNVSDSFGFVAYGVATDSQDNVIVTGYNESNFYTIKYKDGFGLSSQVQGNIVNVGFLESQFTSVGENWSCKVKAYDGEDYSDYTISSSLTILAVPPPAGCDFGVSNCQGIGSPGIYCLTQDLNSSGSCLQIASDDVVIDCRGHNITKLGTKGSMGSTGINFTERDNVIVKNCVLNYFKYGVWSNVSTNIEIENNTFYPYNSTDKGTFGAGTLFRYPVFLNNSNNFVITNNTFDILWISAYDAGTFLYNSNKGNITGNEIKTFSTSNPQYALKLDNSNNNLIKGNNISKYRNSIYVESSANNTILNNTFFGTINSYSIYTVEASRNTRIENNTFRGISNAITIGWIGYSNNDVIIGNTMTNVSTGVFISEGNNTLVKNNNISDNSAYGVYSYNSKGLHNITIDSNILNNNDYGINGRTLVNSRIINNEIKGNRDVGIWLSERVSGYRNGNVVANNSIQGNGDLTTEGGLFLNNVDGNVILNNTITGNQIGLEIRTTSRWNNLTNNDISSNSRSGLKMGGSTGAIFGTKVVNNTIVGNSYSGIYFYYNTYDNDFVNNTVANNGFGGTVDYLKAGISVYQGSPMGQPKNNFFLNNNVSNNNKFGVYLAVGSSSYHPNNSPSNFTFENNTIEGSNYGVLVLGASNSTFTYNNIVNNSYGVNMTLINNSLIEYSYVNSTHRGIFLGSGGNNTFRDNVVAVDDDSSFEFVLGTGVGNSVIDHDSLKIRNIYFNLVTSYWGRSCGWNNLWCAGADIDRDGSVNAVDIARVALGRGKVSFTGNNVKLKSMLPSEVVSLGNATGQRSFFRFFNVTNISSKSYIEMNVTYTEAELNASVVREGTQRIWKYNGTDWINTTFYSGFYGVDSVNNVVSANISSFSIFGVFGKLENDAPVIQNIILNSSLGTDLTDENLTCWVNATDANGNNISYNGSWFKDGVDQGISFFVGNYSSGVLVNVSTLDSRNTSVGDLWSCKVRGYDGIEFGSYSFSENLTIVSAPSPPTGGGGGGVTPPRECTDDDYGSCYWTECLDPNGGAAGISEYVCVKQTDCVGPTTKVFETVDCALPCDENWVCEWTPCEDEDGGVSVYECVDLNECGTFINRPLQAGETTECTVEDCIPDISCGDYGECEYSSGETGEILEGKIRFTGTRTRLCEDNNGCVADYVESTSCFSEIPLDLNVEVDDDGRNLLRAVNTFSGNPVMDVNLDSWKDESKLDISFIQSEEKYSIKCYNGVKDEGEDGVDCGGVCKECKLRAISRFALWPWWAVTILSLLLALLLGGILRESFIMAKIRALLKQGHESLLGVDVSGASSKYEEVRPFYPETGHGKKEIRKEVLGYRLKTGKLIELINRVRKK